MECLFAVVNAKQCQKLRYAVVPFLGLRLLGCDAVMHFIIVSMLLRPVSQICSCHSFATIFVKYFLCKINLVNMLSLLVTIISEISLN